MSERDPSPSKGFEARLAEARAVRDGERGTKDGAAARSGMGVALRIGLEMVSALIVGVGIGWLLDWWLGTGPWLMILFFVLGSAAGMLSVFRTASGLGQGVGYKPGKGKGSERG
ncbi:MAG: AtpZ/AtpI family protein [Rhodospirillaceae bacterium]|nr:AtpZ/AtpI family protein [Rhodospirillaceae bacterium]MBT6117338.1 AtpZ/AtpI family protein [Rhodospirillaceae bacterium]